MAAAWEEHAVAWARWARAPGHDSYWQFHRDAFLPLLPPPRRATLDLGCGEGRLGRHLAALGHRVTGVDASPTLVRLAREAAPDLRIELADAARLPFGEAAFDLVVAFMSLQDVDDLAGAFRESGRVLEPGGRLCLAIVHPLNSAGRFTGNGSEAAFTIERSYLARFRYADVVERDGLPMRFESEHRPLEDYVDGLAAAGFLIEALREPAVPERAITSERARRWTRIPMFLHLRAVRVDRQV